MKYTENVAQFNILLSFLVIFFSLAVSCEKNCSNSVINNA